MATRYTLELKEDFYSLAFYGFYLDSDEEELSAHKNYKAASDLVKLHSGIA